MTGAWVGVVGVAAGWDWADCGEVALAEPPVAEPRPGEVVVPELAVEPELAVVPELAVEPELAVVPELAVEPELELVPEVDDPGGAVTAIEPVTAEKVLTVATAPLVS